MVQKKQVPIMISDTAVKKIKELTSADNKFALRVGVKKGGCAGMEYTLEFVDGVNESEEIIEKETQQTTN